MTMTQSFLQLTLGLVVVAALGCGAEGHEGPHVPLPNENAVCPSTEEALTKTRTALRDGPLSRVGPHVERILVDDGGLRVLLPVSIDLLKQVPVGHVVHILDGYEDGVGLARLVPHLIRVVDYIIGTSDFVSGAHYEVIDTLHALVGESGRTCDTIQTLGAAERLLTLRIVDESGAMVPWIEPFFDAVVDLAEDETFATLLGGIEFEDDGSGEGLAVGREAFQLIARLLLENLAADNLDLDYVRGLLDDIFVLQFPDDETGARGKLTRVLDLLEIVVDPSREIFPYAQALIRCTNEVDVDGHMPGMLYDYFSIRELSLVEFLQDIDAMGADTAGTHLRILLEESLPILQRTPGTTRDAIAVLNRFLDDQVSRDLLPMLEELQGTGVMTELLSVMRRFVAGCDDDEDAP
jgi:hypothetical protein